MKKLMYFLRLFTPAILIIFILGGKPARVKAQENEDKEIHAICLKVVSDKDGKKVVIDTSFTYTEIDSLKDCIVAFNSVDCKDGQLCVKVKKEKDGRAYLYCYSTGEKHGKSMTAVKTRTVKLDNQTCEVTSDADGEVKVILKCCGKNDPDSRTYIIKTETKEENTKEK
jgi:hypothetical protein